MQEPIFTQLHENLRSIISVYFTWYTFFWTFNLAALAWLYGKPGDQPRVVSDNRSRLALLFIFLNVLGILTTGGTGVATFTIAKRITAVCDALPNGPLPRLNPALLSTLAGTSTAPDWLYPGAFGVCVLSIGAVGVCWYGMYRAEPTRSPGPKLLERIDQLYTVQKVAERLSMDEAEVLNLIKTRRITGLRIDEKTLRVSDGSLQRYLTQLGK